MGSKTKNVPIPLDIYTTIEKKVRGNGFESVQDYIVFVLQEVINSQEDTPVAFSPEDDEAMKIKLRELGYLD